MTKEKRISKSVSADPETWRKATEIGSGNSSLGYRKAVAIAHDIWVKEQVEKWSNVGVSNEQK